MKLDSMLKIRMLFHNLDEAARAAYIQYLFDHNLILRKNGHCFKGLELPRYFTDAARLIKEGLPNEALEAWKFIARSEKRPHILWDRGYADSMPFILSPGALDMALGTLVERSENEQHSRWQLEAAELYDSLKGN